VPLDVTPLESAGVPQPVIQLVAACNAKLPADRPQGFAPIIAELERMLGGSQREAPATQLQPVAPAPPKSRTPAIVAGLAAMLVIGMIGAYFVLKPKPAPPPAVVELAKTISTPTGDMVLVPAGEFRYGETRQAATLPAFYIDKTEVGDAAYARFCQATNHPLPEGYPADHPDYPVVNVTIADARQFAAWAGKRLPTDLEWEKAARGTDGRNFPWGDQKGDARSNTGTGVLRPVDSFASGASPYGALQMVGNAWELVDKQRAPAANLTPFNSLRPPVQAGEAWYMIRGESAWEPLADGAVWDSAAVPERWKDLHVGFRCVKDAR